MKNVITAADKAPEKVLVRVSFTADAMSNKRDIELGKLGIEVNDLPDGSKTVWKVDALPGTFVQKYLKLRQRAELRCIEHAACTEHDWVTIKKRASTLLADLDEIKQEWYEQKSADLISYEQIREQHLKDLEADAQKPVVKKGKVVRPGLSKTDARKLRDAVEATQPTLSDIEDRFQFSRYATPLVIDEDGFDLDLFAAQQDMVVSLRDSTMGGLIKELCGVSRDIFKTILKNESEATTADKIRIHGRTVKRVDVLREKLYDLSFIHPHIKTVHDCLLDVLSKLPHRDAALRGVDYQNFKSMISVMSDQIEVTAKLEAKMPLVSVNSVDDSQEDAFAEEQIAVDPSSLLSISGAGTATVQSPAPVAVQKPVQAVFMI